MTDNKGDATVTVERTLTRLGKPFSQNVSTKPIKVKRFQSEPARVGISIGGTFGIGQYESVRVQVSVELPCYPEEVEECYTAARHFVEEKLRAEIKEIRQFGEGRGPF